MSRIRSGNTKPEMLVRKFLHANGFRYSLHGGQPAYAKALAGWPDIVLNKFKTVIFIHACRPAGKLQILCCPETRTKF
jgi:DNA mismatch endonuclease (patch repair protein)